MADTIWVGNIPVGTTQRQVHIFFEDQFGPVDEVIMKDKLEAKLGKSYAFVRFAEESDALRSIEHGKLLMKTSTEPLRLDIAMTSTTKQRSDQERLSGGEDTRVWVGNLPKGVRRYDLYKHFRPYGPISCVDLLGTCNNQFSFIWYEAPEDATRACKEANKTQLLGETIATRWAKAKGDPERFLDRLPTSGHPLGHPLPRRGGPESQELAIYSSNPRPPAHGWMSQGANPWDPAYGMFSPFGAAAQPYQWPPFGQPQEQPMHMQSMQSQMFPQLPANEQRKMMKRLFKHNLEFMVKNKKHLLKWMNKNQRNEIYKHRGSRGRGIDSSSSEDEVSETTSSENADDGEQCDASNKAASSDEEEDNAATARGNEIEDDRQSQANSESTAERKDEEDEPNDDEMSEDSYERRRQQAFVAASRKARLLPAKSKRRISVSVTGVSPTTKGILKTPTQTMPATAASSPTSAARLDAAKQALAFEPRQREEQQLMHQQKAQQRQSQQESDEEEQRLQQRPEEHAKRRQEKKVKKEKKEKEKKEKKQKNQQQPQQEEEQQEEQEAEEEEEDPDKQQQLRQERRISRASAVTEAPTSRGATPVAVSPVRKRRRAAESTPPPSATKEQIESESEASAAIEGERQPSQDSPAEVEAAREKSSSPSPTGPAESEQEAEVKQEEGDSEKEEEAPQRGKKRPKPDDRGKKKSARRSSFVAAQESDSDGSAVQTEAGDDDSDAACAEEDGTKSRSATPPADKPSYSASLVKEFSWLADGQPRDKKAAERERSSSPVLQWLLGVEDVPGDMTAAELNEIAANFGEVLNVSVKPSKEPGVAKGVIEFKNWKSLRRGLKKLNNRRVDGWNRRLNAHLMS
eukprot:TRINITY_DN11439_c0_g1_i1.p1 TRINITY_DN11439_c0_g1~~TRINITY_DN11439_c0_g1_i1.p1  ORF type:complete len:860 (-),score=218.67 TRINITY_DN11439_c0_g1_i1:355-2934(-)